MFDPSTRVLQITRRLHTKFAHQVCSADMFNEVQASLVRIERDTSSQVVVRATPRIYRFAQPSRINGAKANRYSRTLAPNNVSSTRPSQSATPVAPISATSSAPIMSNG